ncbi:MAG: cytochrome b5 domain-containing protein [Candidatus Magasanikbacteria bacterium]|nr:cytochrome b5 domain-containing protein [Candidatus Magasanikbacteria bacterium]
MPIRMLKHPRLFFGIVAAIVLFGGFVVIAFRGRPAVYVASAGARQSGAPAQGGNATGSQSHQQRVSAFSLAQVSAHNSAQSCWTAINGNVYDLTTWIDRHPGGPEVIVGLCGTDSTDAFGRQHGRSRGALYALGLLKIGALQ